MRIIILLLIVIIQQSACVNLSLFDILRIRTQDSEVNEFAKRTKKHNLIPEENVFETDSQPAVSGIYPSPRGWPQMQDDEISEISPDRTAPLSIYKNMRTKRPDKSHMDKLTYLLNNYRENPEPPEINFEEGNKKRTHLFGFWTNYLARN